MVLERQGALAPQPPRSGLIQTLSAVPRSGRWVLPALASAFEGTDASTLEPKVRALVLLRVAAVDRAPYWRERLEAGAHAVGISADEIELAGSDEWETAPAFTDRERAAILWGDRVARRLARRDGSAYRIVREAFEEVEIVELTAIASLAAMADRITNALRIPPDGSVGLTPAGGPVADDSLRRWSRSMFDGETSTTWTEEMAR
jgi:alkylhydroperoxidase family enzyme